MKDKNDAPTLTAGEQTILDQIKRSERNLENYVNGKITEVECKLNALQKGVSNLQSVKTDMKQVKKDVGEMKEGIEQLQADMDTVTDDYGYKRDEGKLIPDKS